MVRRHEKSSFGDAHAFPGGVVDPEDHEVHDYCHGLTEKQANSRLGVQSGGLSYYSAAIREVFEETGVLFADFSNLDENLVSVRNALNDRSMNWAEFVNQNELSLHCGQFFYCSHWITPEKMAKRYSTRFFLAELPEGQIAEHCGGELTDSCWATASDTLAASRRGDLLLHFPTIKTLESVARHDSMVELVDWARSCVEWGITSMVPMVIERNGKNEIVLPGEKDYPGAKS
jgi:8-oxo-dGTP pyrophosphatase MutT (NUDIX family)